VSEAAHQGRGVEVLNYGDAEFVHGLIVFVCNRSATQL
jgi:hypothetical protein